MADQCATCHSGAYPPADGSRRNHIPYQTLSGVAIANCDTCHKGGYTAWTPAQLPRQRVASARSARAATPAAYAPAVGKPNTAIHAGVTATARAATSRPAAGLGAKVDHSTFTAATNCASCHNGSTATGKSATHIPVAATNCISCHSTDELDADQVESHQVAVANQCATCHSGAFPPADGRSGHPHPVPDAQRRGDRQLRHLPQGRLHRLGAGASFHSNVSVSNQCASCHTGGLRACRRQARHRHPRRRDGNCESCHKSTSQLGLGAKVDHSTYTAATNCASCHNGSTATGKSATHIPVARDQLHQLPQHHRLDADQVEPHPGRR